MFCLLVLFICYLFICYLFISPKKDLIGANDEKSNFEFD